MVHNMISLSSENKLFSGGYRDVYQHPLDEKLLIKVMNTSRWERKSRFQKKYLYHYFFTKVFVRETAEYIRLQFRDNLESDFIQSIIGFCHTNLGFGLIVKAELSQTGEYAKTLQHLVDTKQINSEVNHHLKILLEKILATSVIISDLNLKNIVYAYNRNDKSYQFILIDGIGDKTFIPVQNIFPFIRKYCKSKYTRKIKEIINQSDANT